ncbi:MAG: protein translocase subunit SecD [Alphaproteobacteria bacterium]|nr:protein translocase subunit SecD [Alphaproteobacteria bacterium]
MLHFPRWKIVMIVTVCLTFVTLAIPTFIPESTRNALPDYFPKRAVNLGLDLQGGSHLLLEVDFESFKREQLSNLAGDIRAALREEKIGYRGLSQIDGAVQFTLREALAEGRDVAAILRKMDGDLEITANGLDYLVRFNDAWMSRSRQQVIEQSLQIVSRRINETGTKEPIIQRQGTERILVQVPGLTDPEHLKRLLGRTAKMTFHMLDETVSQQDIAAGVAPVGTRLLSSDDRDQSGNLQRFAVQSRVMLSGDMLVDSHASYDQQTGEPVVAFRFNNAGARKFAEITTENVGRPFAIVLDNKVITAPVIRSPILGGSGIISGNFTTESANDLALLLRAGALPAPLVIIEERSVGPSLGADSIEAGTKASLIGISLVVLFMVIFYGLFGMFANIAMIVNAFMTIALLALFQATLTLPGIAGIVLTVGMAVDANVLIYERMREEIRNGKSPYAAVEDGFRIAFGTIFDSHVTTLLAALILFQFGSGAVKGFAVTLGIGVACSLFTAVLVTRLMVVTWLRRTKPKVLPL